MIERVLQYVQNQLHQPSTYRGLALIVASVGHWSSVDYVTQQQIFMDVGLGVAGFIGAILPDRIGRSGRAGDPPADARPEPPKEAP